MDEKMLLYTVLLWSAFYALAGAQRCPNQWAGYQDQCFRFVYNSKLPWRDARNFCRLHGGDLLKIQSVQQRNWVINRARAVARSRNFPSLWWTGLNNLEYLSAWSWADGFPVNDTLIAWSPGEPNNWRSRERCGEVWGNNRMNDESCDATRNFICSRDKSVPILCDADRGWQTLDGQCFKVYTYTTSWTGARSRCNRDGGALVTIDSYALETTVHDLAVTAKQPLWLGLHSIKVDAQTAIWKWLPNGTADHTSGYWQNLRPPIIDRAHLNTTCAVMSNLGSPMNAWYPQSCYSVRAFVCQKPEGVCFPGWIGHRRNCYQFNPHFHLGFNGAAQFCQSQGAELIRIQTSNDQLFLNSYLQEMSDSGSDSFWIGLSDNNNDNGPYKWRNKQTVTTHTYRNWAAAKNTPTNEAGKTDCVFINTNDVHGKWRITTSCQSAKSFICTAPMGKMITSPPSTPPPVFGCPNGWKLHAGTCYLINNTATDAFSARQFCQQTPGSDLARVTTADIQAFLNGLLPKAESYYIGLNDLHTNNIFMWNDDSYLTSNYTNWLPKEPNDYHHQESCVVIHKQQWNDMSCSAKQRFICSMVATSQFIPPVPTEHIDWTVKCGVGWESNPMTNDCYMFSDEPLEWTDARLQCQVYGGDLVTITSLVEQNFLAGRLTSMKSLAVWTGANDRKSEGGWSWASGEGFAFLNWAPGQPGGDKGQGTDCVAMLTTTAQWDDINCVERNGYVCEKKGNLPTTKPPVTTTMKPPAGMVYGCPPGWLPFENNCYQVNTRQITWDYASTVCSRRNARLASVRDKNEQNFLVANIPKFNSTWHGYWIGLNDKKTDNDFQWSDGSKVTYTNWNKNEPNNYMNRNEDCVDILQKNGLWNDQVCNVPMQGFVCKMPKSFVSATQNPYAKGCPLYTVGYGPYCYWLIGNSPKTFDDANTRCNSSFSGQLATVNDRYLQAFLATRMVWRNGNYWIGLTDKASPGTYKWLSGSKVDYTNWDRNHTGNEKSTCVAMRANIPIGVWDNNACTTKNNYICQFARDGYTTPPTPGTPWANVPCPPGWTAYQGFCYMLNCNNTKTWMAAEAHCQSMGGDLPSIHSQDVDTFLVNFTKSQSCQHESYWFGLNARAAKGAMQWSDGSPIDYTNWHKGEPNNYGGLEECGTFTSTGYKWNDNVCYRSMSYVCALPRGQQPVTTPVPPTGFTTYQCGFDGSWLYFNGSCYLPSDPSGVNATLSWYDAGAWCASHGATLASVHNNYEMEFLHGSSGRSTPWLGLNILGGTKYQWTDGTPVDYQNWNTNEPNNYGGIENCVHVTATGKWNDHICQRKRAFVCRRPLNGVATKAVPSPNPPGGCSNGFTMVPGGRNKCFYIGGTTSDTLRNFTSARTFCQSFGPGYDLASIEDQFEQEFLITMTAKYNTSMWIGLEDSRMNGEFYWQDGTPVIYTNWDRNNPRSARDNNRNKNLQNCVMMRTVWKGHYGKWWDVNCQRNNAFICQTKQDPNVPTIRTAGACANTLYKSFRNNCYKRSSSAKTWLDASTDCQADGGQLVSIADRIEMAFVITIAARNAPYWIGLSDVKFAGLYSWSDGWPIHFTNWGPGQPKFSQASGHGCVFYDQNGQWNDSDCTNVFNYVCKISSATPPPTIPPTSGNCTNSSQVPYGDYCYYVDAAHSLSFPDAAYACDKLGMQLTSVHGGEEMTFLLALAQQYQPAKPSSNPNLWIGLSKGFNGAFMWSDRTSVNYLYWNLGQPSTLGAFMWSDRTSVNYLYWNLGQPSTLGGRGQLEECVEMNKQSGLWDDISCFLKRGYICKTLKAFHTPKTPPPTYHYTNFQPPVPGRSTYDIFVPPTWPYPPWTQPGYPQYTQPPYVYTNPRYPPAVTQGPPPPFNYPAYTNPPIYTPQPQKQTQSQASSSSGGGMSGGAIAGIIIAVIIILAFVVLIVIYMRKTGKMNELKGALGFDNALYKNEPEDIQL